LPRPMALRQRSGNPCRGRWNFGLPGEVAGGFDDHCAGRFADLCGHKRALDGEEEKDRAAHFRKGFIIPLPLGDDEGGTAEVVEEFRRTVSEDRPRGVGSVVNDCDMRGDAGEGGVFAQGIVEDGLAADGKGDASPGEFFEEEGIEDNFAGVVGEVEDAVGVFGGTEEPASGL